MQGLTHSPTHRQTRGYFLARRLKASGTDAFGTRQMPADVSTIPGSGW